MVETRTIDKNKPLYVSWEVGDYLISGSLPYPIRLSATYDGYTIEIREYPWHSSKLLDVWTTQDLKEAITWAEERLVELAKENAL